MKLIPEELFVACLDALENGDAAAEILARHPDFADELRMFLATAVHLTQLPVQPTLAARQASQKQFLRQAADMRAATQMRQTRRRWYQLLAPVVSLVFLLIVGGSLVVASGSAQPGNALYGVRQWVETIRFTPTAEPEPSPQPSYTPHSQKAVDMENTAVPTATTPAKEYPTATPTPTRPVVTETAVPAPTATATTQPATPAATATASDDVDSGNDDSINDNDGEDNGSDVTDGGDDGGDNADNDNGDNDDNGNDNLGGDDDSNSNDNDDDGDNDNDDGGNSGPGNNNNDNDDDDDNSRDD